MKRLYRHRFFPAILAAAHLTIAGAAVYIVDHHSKSTIKEMLYGWGYWNLEINFFLISAAILACRREIATAIGSLKNRTGAALGVVLVVGVLLIGLAAPRGHRIYYDEDIYLNVGQTMASIRENVFANYATFEYGEYEPHWKSYNKEPGGWPYLTSLMFRLFGVREERAFDLNNILYAGSILLMFFLARQLTGKPLSALISAGVIAFTPHHVIWCDTAAAEPSAAFLTALTVLSAAVYLRSGATRHLFLLTVLIPFTAQMRPESPLVILLVAALFLFTAPGQLLSRKVWAFALLIAIFMAPYLLHIYAVSGESWGSAGAKFAWQYLGPNFQANGSYYLSNAAFPVLFTLAAAAGLLGNGLPRGWRWALGTWFLLFWGIFLFFYAGSYRYGADVRFALLSFMPLALLAGAGGAWITEKLVGAFCGNRGLATLCVLLLLGFNAVQLFPTIRPVGQEAWGARYDHRYAREFIDAIPDRSIVLSQTPTMFLLWGQSAIQTYAGLANREVIEQLFTRYDGHVYYHHSFWCNTLSERNRRLCRAIREAYQLTEVASATEQDHHYGLYRMAPKASPEN